jgi:hypothetical protein
MEDSGLLAKRGMCSLRKDLSSRHESNSEDRREPASGREARAASDGLPSISPLNRSLKNHGQVSIKFDEFQFMRRPGTDMGRSAARDMQARF